LHTDVRELIYAISEHIIQMLVEWKLLQILPLRIVATEFRQYCLSSLQSQRLEKIVSNLYKLSSNCPWIVFWYSLSTLFRYWTNKTFCNFSLANRIYQVKLVFFFEFTANKRLDQIISYFVRFLWIQDSWVVLMKVSPFCSVAIHRNRIA